MVGLYVSKVRKHYYNGVNIYHIKTKRYNFFLCLSLAPVQMYKTFNSFKCVPARLPSAANCAKSHKLWEVLPCNYAFDSNKYIVTAVLLCTSYYRRPLCLVIVTFLTSKRYYVMIWLSLSFALVSSIMATGTHCFVTEKVNLHVFDACSSLSVAYMIATRMLRVMCLILSFIRLKCGVPGRK